MAIERYGSKTDVVVKLVLVFFVCLLSFSVGTFVGKTFSDNQHRLAQFEPASADREVASTTDTKGEHAAKAGEALSDDEIAKLAEEFVNDEEGHAGAKTETAKAEPAKVDEHGAAEGHGAPAKTEVAKTESHGDHAAPAKAEVAKVDAHAGHAAPARNVAEAKPEPKHEAPSAVAAAVAHGHAPAAHEAPKPPSKNPASTEAKVTLKPDTEKKPIPTSLPQDVAASAIGKYTVQVASYPTETEATKMTENLKGQGFGAFYIKADITDKKTSTTKTWYRVSVGLFQSQKEADAYKADLLSRSKVSSAIVQKISK